MKSYGKILSKCRSKNCQGCSTLHGYLNILVTGICLKANRFIVTSNTFCMTIDMTCNLRRWLKNRLSNDIVFNSFLMLTLNCNGKCRSNGIRGIIHSRIGHYSITHRESRSGAMTWCQCNWTRIVTSRRLGPSYNRGGGTDVGPLGNIRRDWGYRRILGICEKYQWCYFCYIFTITLLIQFISLLLFIYCWSVCYISRIINNSWSSAII